MTNNILLWFNRFLIFVFIVFIFIIFSTDHSNDLAKPNDRIPTFNGSCLYSLDDAKQIMNSKFTELSMNYEISVTMNSEPINSELINIFIIKNNTTLFQKIKTVFQSYSSNLLCANKVKGSSLPQGVLYTDIKNHTQNKIVLVVHNANQTILFQFIIFIYFIYFDFYLRNYVSKT